MGLKQVLLGASFILTFMASDGCASISRPKIKVAIGMTVDQLRAGSTYPFKTDAATANLNSWVISQPYDLVYVYNGSQLKEENLGGNNYLISIIANSQKKKIIDQIQITFQNRALTVDEALAVARRLNEWFVDAGFKPAEPGVDGALAAFNIVESERSGVQYSQSIGSYDAARAALLDADAKVISLQPFSLVTNDTEAGVSITNARRQEEDVSGDDDEKNASSERKYFVTLYVTARPIDRYWDFKAR